MKILDADSRVGKLLDELKKVLERNNQEGILKDEVTRQEANATASQKPLRSDVFRFVNWLRTFENGYQLYGGAEDEENPAKPAKSQDGRGLAPKRPDEKNPDGGAGSAKPRSADRATKSDAPSAPARKPAARLKFKSTAHKVTDCSNTAPGEAQALIAAQIQKWKTCCRARPTSTLRGRGEDDSGGEGRDARSLGLRDEDDERLEQPLSKFVGVFRTDVGNDALIKEEPLKSVLKSQKSRLQDDGQPPDGVTWNDDIKFYVTPNDKIWFPDVDLDLQQRLCVIAHQGAAGHRCVAATTQSVAAKFEWTTLKADVTGFVTRCLHCMCVDGDMVPPPPGICSAR
ncbi:hypothetical protein H310_14162 [Aphanomyces invadans]|uniref:Integrase zinc-binding domain-containing protein n=1 Tax=Aphanomyces invadans TaxID=157072 RepID=A0A024TC26_9STRA|nr:hypothetical protein H310_14162 [Aphanomyces invadans]ETV91151.1 hypothetical protein H310_14162 [Aphanomyces invadans]|eukprot:XP_008880182.1 hypothetical protein H310_14162 [Aphanomyces invadans]